MQVPHHGEGSNSSLPSPRPILWRLPWEGRRRHLHREAACSPRPQGWARQWFPATPLPASCCLHPRTPRPRQLLLATTATQRKEIHLRTGSRRFPAKCSLASSHCSHHKTAFKLGASTLACERHVETTRVSLRVLDMRRPVLHLTRPVQCGVKSIWAPFPARASQTIVFCDAFTAIVTARAS
jgi:hypothetical protein